MKFSEICMESNYGELLSACFRCFQLYVAQPPISDGKIVRGRFFLSGTGCIAVQFLSDNLGLFGSGFLSAFGRVDVILKLNRILSMLCWWLIS